VIVLAFDTATPATAVALRGADGAVAEARDDPAPGARPGHATRLLPMADALLGEAGLRWRDVERIAVGVGPGTFTGLRVGVATARGLAQSLGVELVAVSSLRALAFEAARRVSDAYALAVIDARRGEVFAAAYALDGLRELSEPRAVAPAEIGRLLDREAGSWVAYGDGALRYREELERVGVEVRADPDLHEVRARAICALGLEAQPRPELAVAPDYRRQPDAELALKGGPA
jgi:tRNA threonylcarbamoyladenosine biosynthesis protein TsaB